MKSLVRSLVIGSASLAVLLVTPPAAAQTRLVLDGTGAMVFETDGPPTSCGYPTGPVTGSFSYVAPFTCPTAGRVGGSSPFVGDVGSDRFKDTIWVTDGFTFTEYAGSGAAYGTPLSSFDLPVGFVLPGPVTGMDFVGTYGPPGFLVITDGRWCAGITPPAAPGCALPTVAVAPFPLPWPGFATDLAWQSGTGGVWVCDDLGFVSEVYLDGTPGQWGSFSVAPGACGLVPPLTGIAADGAPGGFANDSLDATDGVTVARFVVDQTPPFPQMHAPFPCFPLPAPSCNGLGSTLHPIGYGVGTDTGGLVPPVMTSTGQTTINSSAPITLTLSGADTAPGTLCVLIYSPFSPPCPPKTILGGNSLYVTPWASPVGPLAVFGGTVSVSFTTLDASSALFLGFPVHLQWLVAKGSGGYQVSNAMAFLLGWP